MNGATIASTMNICISRYGIIFLVTTISMTAAAGPKQAQPGTPAPSHIYTPQDFTGPLPVFEFHSGFWTNLHHFLYQQARLKKAAETAFQTPGGTSGMEQPARTDGLSATEQAAWNSALAYYTRNMSGKDLLFNGDLVNYKNQLAQLETCADLTGHSRPQCDAGIPAEIARALETAAPVYRTHWWLEHDRANRSWIAGVSPLVQRMGRDMARDLAVVYQANWPSEKIRVDVTRYAGWAGAYTTLDPIDVTLSSIDPRNQGLSGFEILFHEASHALAEFVRDAIVRECRDRGKPIPRDLWHALLFYTTGEIVKRNLSTHDVPVKTAASAVSVDAQTASDLEPQRKRKPAPALYTPYAFREGLYARGWSDYLKLLEKFWQPYLDGNIEFATAIARMTSAL
jgi:hypothetical protein